MNGALSSPLRLKSHDRDVKEVLSRDHHSKERLKNIRVNMWGMRLGTETKENVVKMSKRWLVKGFGEKLEKEREGEGRKKSKREGGKGGINQIDNETSTVNLLLPSYPRPFKLISKS